jgi:MFS family permease
MRKEPFLYIIAFLVDGSFAVVGLCVPLLAMSIGATYDDLGAMSATGALAYSLGCFAVGRVSDRFGYRRFMSIACVGVALIFLTYPLVSAVWQLFVLAALTGPLLAGFWPCLQAWLGRGKDRRQLLGAVGGFNVAWSLGFLVGPAAAGFMYSLDPHHVFHLAAAAAALVFAALLFLRLRDDANTVPADDSELHSLAAARHFLPVAWVANFATFVAVGSVRSLFPKLATDLGISTSLLGILLALIGLGQVTMFVILARTERWQFRGAPMVAIQALAMAGLLGFAYGTSTACFAVAMVLQGLLIGATFTSSIFYSLHAKGSEGKRTGIHEGIIGSGVFLGPLVGGLVAEHVGPRAPYLVAAGVLAAAVLVELLLLRRANVAQPAAVAEALVV